VTAKACVAGSPCATAEGRPAGVRSKTQFVALKASATLSPSGANPWPCTLHDMGKESVQPASLQRLCGLLGQGPAVGRHHPHQRCHAAATGRAYERFPSFRLSVTAKRPENATDAQPLHPRAPRCDMKRASLSLGKSQTAQPVSGKQVFRPSIKRVEKRHSGSSTALPSCRVLPSSSDECPIHGKSEPLESMGAPAQASGASGATSSGIGQMFQPTGRQAQQIGTIRAIAMQEPTADRGFPETVAALCV